MYNPTLPRSAVLLKCRLFDFLVVNWCDRFGIMSSLDFQQALKNRLSPPFVTIKLNDGAHTSL